MADILKRYLGLDLGTASIGWALVNELSDGTHRIEKLGVRVNPLSTDEKTDFEKGNPLSTNANRTLKRGARRNLQRYKLRRKNLIEILKDKGFITNDTALTEVGKDTTFQTLALRAKAASEKISLEELARVFLTMNKKRGYKSNRKANNKDEDTGQAIDGMQVAKELYENELTPGQYALRQLGKKNKFIPDFYRSDLQAEFDAIWTFQQSFYADILTKELYEKLQRIKKGKKNPTWAICKQPFGIVGIKQKGSSHEKKLERYQWRADGLTEQLDLEYLAIVLQEINGDLSSSSGYLGKISDRSKELYFKQETVGQHLYRRIQENRHTRLRGEAFYRQDYLDEFEKIWETQATFHPQLTPELKEEIRDVIIFYQRKLKSQKHSLSYCQFESWEGINKKTGKKQTIGHKVIPKSSPLFQEFKIWQQMNNLQFTNQETGEIIELKTVDDELRVAIFEELNKSGDVKPREIFKIISKHITGLGKISLWKCNFETILGNNTNKKLYAVYQKIAETYGGALDWNKKSVAQIKIDLNSIFKEAGIDASILDFDTEKKGDEYDKQSSFQLWHLLYAALEESKVSEEDRMIYGTSNVSLKKKLGEKFGFNPTFAGMLANVTFKQDYGSLSSRAIRKILPFLKAGHIYSEACALAKYNHSGSMTTEEQANRILKPYLEIVRKNSLRNPVVEKILNQMVNLVNQLIDEYGKIDEVRIELARELKKNAKQRGEMTKNIKEATNENEKIRQHLEKEFKIPNPTRNDVIRYRLWEELKDNGYKALFSNQKIPQEKLFSKDINIEHIIPKAILFDDSFSNKTLAYRDVNQKKDAKTAWDFIQEDKNAELEQYKSRVEALYKAKGISEAKKRKLLMSRKDLPEDFIERDLRNSQYIAKKAKAMLGEVFRTVVSTSGSITDKLRSDWGLIDVMKELNLPKYEALGLVEMQERRPLDDSNKNRTIKIIKDWTKRNDHRHHAMDALTVAFTTHNHIQYLNYLNAAENKRHEKHKGIANIEKKIKRKGRFISPMLNFREEAKKHLEEVLVSFKAKNKVMTKKENEKTTKNKEEVSIQEQLTPRGQLHKETVHGKIKRPSKKLTKLTKKFSVEQAQLIIHPEHRRLVLEHLAAFDNNPKVAFDAKTLKKQPLKYKGEPLEKVHCFEEIYTIRKKIDSGLNIENVVDSSTREILKKRLEEYNNDPKEAFSNLEEEPIWLNKDAGIAIERVTIKANIKNVVAIHTKKNHLGKLILDKEGRGQPVDFMELGNNHHVAIYRDAEGNLQERVVSFFYAVNCVNQGLSAVDKEYNRDVGWEFLFTMKKNEMFVFPSEKDGFNPNEIDLLDEKNTALISKHLFRVQQISSKNYMFSHHLETKVMSKSDLKNKKMLSGITYRSIRSTEPLRNIVKVRINHIGKIVQLGEY